MCALTLFATGGAYMPPRHVFVYICANTCMSALKNFTFPNYEFGKGQYAFYPAKLSRFAEKNTIKAGGSTVRAQNVDWVMDGWSG